MEHLSASLFHAAPFNTNILRGRFQAFKHGGSLASTRWALTVYVCICIHQYELYMIYHRVDGTIQRVPPRFLWLTCQVTALSRLVDASLRALMPCSSLGPVGALNISLRGAQNGSSDIVDDNVFVDDNKAGAADTGVHRDSATSKTLWAVTRLNSLHGLCVKQRGCTSTMLFCHIFLAENINNLGWFEGTHES